LNTEQTNRLPTPLALIAVCSVEDELNDAPPPGLETARAPAPARTAGAPAVGPNVPGGITEKLDALTATPPGVVTEIGPVVAAGGTVALINVIEGTVKTAGTALNFVEDAPARFTPLMETRSPTELEEGENDVIAGTPGVTVKLVELVAVPAAATIWIVPVVAPIGTVAVT